MMEKQIKIGEIQYIKPDRKSFTIENIWYNNKFKAVPEEIKKGFNVKIEFVSKDDKNYWQKIYNEEIKKIEQEQVKEEIKKELNNEPELTKEFVSEKTLNTLIMSLVSLYNDPNNETDIEHCAEVLIKGFKKIKELL